MGKQLLAETIYAGLSALPRATRRWPRSWETDRGSQIPHMTPIAEPPAEVATRTQHWEGDLL